MWLTGRMPADVAGGIAGRAGGAGEACQQRLRRRSRLLRDCQRASNPAGSRLQTQKHMAGLDLKRGLCDLVGDVRVAVAIATHPTAPMQERQDLRLVWFIRPLEGPLELAIQHRHEREERLIEDRHQASNLVHHCGPLPPQLGGSPENADLLAKAALGVCSLGRRQPRIVELVHHLCDPAQGVDHRPPAGFSRMGCEDRADLESRKQFSQLVLIELATQLVERGCQRLGDNCFLVAALPEDAHAVAFLSQVAHRGHDMREAPDHAGGRLELEVGEHDVEHLRRMRQARRGDQRRPAPLRARRGRCRPSAPRPRGLAARRGAGRDPGLLRTR